MVLLYCWFGVVVVEREGSEPSVCLYGNVDVGIVVEKVPNWGLVITGDFTSSW